MSVNQIAHPRDHLRDLGQRSVSQVRDVLADEAATVAERAAARIILQALDADAYSPRDQREAFHEWADRTSGKPHQSIDLQVEHSVDPVTLLENLERMAAVNRDDLLTLPAASQPQPIGPADDGPGTSPP